MNTDLGGYFDYNATTPLSPAVADAMVASLPLFSNASSSSKQAQQSKQLLAESRGNVAKLLNCEPEQVVFTSGGSEANNWAIKGSLMLHLHSPGHIITTEIEHPSVLDTIRYMENSFGFRVTRLRPGSNGAISLADLAAAIEPDTQLISVMYANNETGVLQPVEAIAALAREKGIRCHVDAVQVVGKMPVDLSRLGADYVACSAHKFYGPKGIGCLYVRETDQLEPLIHGGGQELGQRAGTENLTAIAGIGQAAQDCHQWLDQWQAHNLECKAQMMAQMQCLPFEIHLNGTVEPGEAVANTLNFSISGVRAEALAALLDRKCGIQVSIGSACSNNDESKAHSHVLTAMGYDKARIQGALRVSFGRYTRAADIDNLVEQLTQCTERLLQMSEMA